MVYYVMIPCFPIGQYEAVSRRNISSLAGRAPVGIQLVPFELVRRKDEKYAIMFLL